MSNNSCLKKQKAVNFMQAMKHLSLSLCLSLLALSCASENSFVAFDNNSDRTLRFVQLLPEGVDNQEQKIEVENVISGTTSSLYSFDRFGWQDTAITNASFTFGIRVATGSTSAVTEVTGPLNVTGMQPDKDNYLVIEGAYPNITIRVSTP